MTRKTKAKLIYQARKTGAGWADIADIFGQKKNTIIRWAIYNGVWNRVENDRLEALDRLKKAVKKLSP